MTNCALQQLAIPQKEGKFGKQIEFKKASHRNIKFIHSTFSAQNHNTP